MSAHIAHERGYYFCWPPVIDNLTPEEEHMLNVGAKVYEEEFGGEDGNGKKAGTYVSPDDRSRIEEYKEERGLA